MLWLEYKEWMEFYTLEPWGCAVEDDRFAKLFNAPLMSVAGKEHKWVETKRVFPRTKADMETPQEKQENNPELMAHDLMTALKGLNRTPEAPTP